MRRSLFSASAHTALNLLVFTLAGTALLAATFNQTHQTIARSEEAEKLRLIGQIMPSHLYDNDILKDTVSVAPNPLLGATTATLAYRGRLHGQPSGLVIEAIVPDGYSGKISLIVALHYDGSLSGVRVVAHKETPGLGDYIEATKNNWIKGFDGKTLGEHAAQDWQVKKDGGQFDYMAGATITPRAVVKAVHKVLEFYAAHREILFATTQVTAQPIKE